MKKLGYLLILLLGFVSCKPMGHKEGKPTLMVTIEPLRFFTEALAGDQYEVISMVPRGMNPEIYDPTPQQMIDLNHCKAYFRIGYIGFEQVWMDKLVDNVPHLKVYDTSEGVRLICGEGHHHEDHELETHHHHHGGVEPHIWNSTFNAEVIAENIYSALCEMDGESQPVYQHRLDSLKQIIAQTDSCIRESLNQGDNAFLIYHPALTYYANDYNLKQICIEDGGKEPSPRRLKELMDSCQQYGVNVLFLQKEFSMDNALLVANELGLRIVPINPLSYQWQNEMEKVARTLKEH